MIPYFQIPVYKLGPIPLDPWGTLVCIGFVVGLEVARARGIRAGLDVRDVVDGIVATVGGGFIGGHLVDVLVYHPEKIEKHGTLILAQLWAGQSSFGGFAGAVVGSLLFYGLLRKRDWMTHADVIMFGLPFGWALSRTGCFLAHDHIGALSDFPLAIQYPGGARHNLGLYEALWTAVIAAVFWWRGRQARPAGYFLMTWCLLYPPVRFGLDFLRNQDLPNEHLKWALQDSRFAGLTPAQWGCLVLFPLGLLLWRRLGGFGAKAPAAAATAAP